MASNPIFKVDVEYEDNAHPPQRVAVQGVPQTAKEAEEHCLKHLWHRDETGRKFPCVKAIAVSDQSFTPDQAPRVKDKSTPQDTAAPEVVNALKALHGS